MKTSLILLSLFYSVVGLAKVDLERLEATARWKSDLIRLESDQSGYKITLYKIADVKTIRDANAYVTKTVSIPVSVEYKANGYDHSLRKSFKEKKGWIEGDFSNLESHQVSDLFDRYEGRIGNVGVGIVGLRSTRAKSDLGITLSRINLESPMAGLGNEAILNVGLSNLSYEVIVKPKSDRAVKELVLSENGKLRSVKTAIELSELEHLSLGINGW